MIGCNSVTGHKSFGKGFVKLAVGKYFFALSVLIILKAQLLHAYKSNEKYRCQGRLGFTVHVFVCYVYTFSLQFVRLRTLDLSL